MSSGSVKWLAAVVIVLFGVLYLLNAGNRGEDDGGQELLVPDLKARLNDLTSVAVTDSDGRLTIERADDAWRVKEKQGYPADTATLRQVLLAIADARRIERKTANADLYEKLGVQDPIEEGGDGVLVSGKAGQSDGSDDFAFAVILGDRAQGDYRYARIPDEDQSWLVDKNPDVPGETAGWLDDAILDVPAADVQSVRIRHADGETIALHKEKAEAGTFDVQGMPEGRSLSYPTVVNPIAGALGSLTLEDVAAVEDSGFAGETTAVYETFDGLRIEITAAGIEEATWITVAASAPPQASAASGPEGDAQPAGETDSGDAPAGADGAAEEPASVAAGADAAGAESGDAAPSEDPADAAPAETRPDPAAQAATINARTGGWRYRVAEYKADQLTRRWADLLKAEDEDE